MVSRSTVTLCSFSNLCQYLCSLSVVFAISEYSIYLPSQLLSAVSLFLPFFLAFSASRDFPPPHPFIRRYSLCIFRMVLPFENTSAEDRGVEREHQHRLVFALLRSDPTADCLATMATNQLDIVGHNFR